MDIPTDLKEDECTILTFKIIHTKSDVISMRRESKNDAACVAGKCDILYFQKDFYHPFDIKYSHVPSWFSTKSIRILSLLSGAVEIKTNT